MPPFISIKNISKSFVDKKVLNGVSFELNKGEISALIGRSGCGKTTLIKILVGYYEADSGEIDVDGSRINLDEIKKIVGYTTQENSFYEKLSIIENMHYYANLYNLNDKQRIEKLLKSVSLLENQETLAGAISGGMKRRLDFALSLIHKPELVILDEPTTGLDPILIEQFWGIVEEIVKKQNISVLVTSHILSEVKDHCRHAFIMHKGMIAANIKITKDTDIEKEFRNHTQ